MISGSTGAPPRRTLATAVALMLIAGVMSSILHLGVRVVGQRLPAIEVAFLRTLVTVILTLPLVFRPGQSSWRTAAPGLQFVRGVIGVASLTTWYYALANMPLADAGALNMTTAIFVTIGAALVLGERVGVVRWTAVAVGLAGALIMLGPGSGTISFAALAALLSTLLWAVSLLLAKHLTRYDSTVTIAFYQVATISPLAGLFVIGVWVWPSADDALVLAGMGVVAGIANFSSLHALRLADASLLMPIDYAKIVWACLWGYLLFAEVPGLQSWLGALLIVAATVFMTVHEHRSRGGH